ncbi:hypothetical protein [Rathayibacter sp. AY1A3]|uniref:hypothetical protein n=1 Tax=Rathayibacter sp. AY1A3 TaxID=2080521 RepID=UPI0011B06CBB|nr:hypothetical protein [Rathayibacter sp. AY1A3]
MPRQDGDPRSTTRVLRELVAAFEDPGAVHPALARQVRSAARELLGASEREPLLLRVRMPTLMVPRSVVDEVPDPPPVPPAAL